MDAVVAPLVEAAAASASPLLDETARRSIGDALCRVGKAFEDCLGSGHRAVQLVEQLQTSGGDAAKIAAIEAQLHQLQQELQQRLAGHAAVEAAVQQLAGVLAQPAAGRVVVNAGKINGAGVSYGTQYIVVTD